MSQHNMTVASADLSIERQQSSQTVNSLTVKNSMGSVSALRGYIRYEEDYIDDLSYSVSRPIHAETIVEAVRMSLTSAAEMSMFLKSYKRKGRVERRYSTFVLTDFVSGVAQMSGSAFEAESASLRVGWSLMTYLNSAYRAIDIKEGKDCSYLDRGNEKWSDFNYDDPQFVDSVEAFCLFIEEMLGEGGEEYLASLRISNHKGYEMRGLKILEKETKRDSLWSRLFD